MLSDVSVVLVRTYLIAFLSILNFVLTLAAAFLINKITRSYNPKTSVAQNVLSLFSLVALIALSAALIRFLTSEKIYLPFASANPKDMPEVRGTIIMAATYMMILGKKFNSYSQTFD
jgi:hypothetical protein